MRVILLISILGQVWSGYAQNVNKALDKVISDVDSYYEYLQPYSMIVNVASVHHFNGKAVGDTKKNNKYKIVVGDEFIYSYISTTQVFQDSIGELIIDNQKQLIEFNGFRTHEHKSAGQNILAATDELNLTINEVKKDKGKIILFFTNELKDVKVEYIIVNNQIIESTHRNYKEGQGLVYMLKTTFNDLKPNIEDYKKYKMDGHGRIANDEFIPNAKYAEYEIFNY